MGVVGEMSDEKPLSTDPHDGLAPVVTPPASTGPKMSAAKPQRAFGQTEIAFPDRPNPEVTRQDNSLFGMPPEVAALSGLAVGRAMGVAGLTAAGRAVAGLKAAGAQVAPVIKYEVVKSALQAAGISPTLATAGAMAISAYKGGATTAGETAAKDTGVAAEATQTAAGAPASVAAQPPVAAPIASPAQASPAGAVAQGPPSSVGKAMNDLLQMAKDAKTAGKPTLRTSEQVNQAFKLIQTGTSPADAFQQVTASDAFNRQFGLSTPTGNDLRFPKGMRGNPSGAQQ